MTSTFKGSTLVVFFLICALAWGWPAASLGIPDHTILAKFERWMAQHGRTYKTKAEKLYRLRIFTKNMKYVDAFYRTAATHTYTIGLNQFADLTNEEFVANYTCYRRSNAPKPGTTPFLYENVTRVASTVDWRTRGAVTPVKDQGRCGSCWAFSTVATIERITKIKTDKLIYLSELALVNCDFSNGACDGGWQDKAFAFVTSNGGITTEANYPYLGYQGICNITMLSDHAASIAGFEYVPVNDEKAPTAAVANQPVSVSIEAKGTDFQLYTGGIFSGPCGTDLDHAVTAVGYGTWQGTNYWIAKDSWGRLWGEKGYVLMRKDVAAKRGTLRHRHGRLLSNRVMKAWW